MNTQSPISHRMFVAALSGGHASPARPLRPPVQVQVESAALQAASLAEKLRRERNSAPVLRPVLSLGRPTAG